MQKELEFQFKKASSVLGYNFSESYINYTSDFLDIHNRDRRIMRNIFIDLVSTAAKKDAFSPANLKKLYWDEHYASQKLEESKASIPPIDLKTSRPAQEFFFLTKVFSGRKSDDQALTTLSPAQKKKARDYAQNTYCPEFCVTTEKELLAFLAEP